MMFIIWCSYGLIPTATPIRPLTAGPWASTDDRTTRQTAGSLQRSFATEQRKGLNLGNPWSRFFSLAPKLYNSHRRYSATEAPELGCKVSFNTQFEEEKSPDGCRQCFNYFSFHTFLCRWNKHWRTTYCAVRSFCPRCVVWGQLPWSFFDVFCTGQSLLWRWLFVCHF